MNAFLREESKPKKIMKQLRNSMEGGPLSGEISQRIQSRRGRGKPLSSEMLQDYSEKFQRNMTDVRLHDDAESAKLNAKLNAHAFTVGSDIFLGKGTDPNDKKLISHELAHVAQTNGKAPSGSLTLGAADTAQEKEADSGEARSTAPAGTVQRWGIWKKIKKWFSGLFKKKPRTQESAAKPQEGWTVVDAPDEPIAQKQFANETEDQVKDDENLAAALGSMHDPKAGSSLIDEIPDSDELIPQSGGTSLEQIDDFYGGADARDEDEGINGEMDPYGMDPFEVRSDIFQEDREKNVTINVDYQETILSGFPKIRNELLEVEAKEKNNIPYTVEDLENLKDIYWELNDLNDGLQNEDAQLPGMTLAILDGRYRTMRAHWNELFQKVRSQLPDEDSSI